MLSLSNNYGRYFIKFILPEFVSYLGGKRHTVCGKQLIFLGQAYGRYSIKFILPEFVSNLRERGVLCVGNGLRFCTPVLMNKCDITFQVLRLSIFVFTQCSEKNMNIYLAWHRAF